jgi:hypothetical protein
MTAFNNIEALLRTKHFFQCIGKRVPILEYYAASHIGELWLAHFDYMWVTSAERSVRPGFANFLLRELSDRRVWLNVYTETRRLAREQLAMQDDQLVTRMRLNGLNGVSAIAKKQNS